MLEYTDGHQVVAIIKDSPADRAGLKAGDLVVEVGGTRVQGLSHDAVVQLVKRQGSQVSVLVTDTHAAQHNGNLGPQPSGAMLAASAAPGKGLTLLLQPL